MHEEAREALRGTDGSMTLTAGELDRSPQSVLLYTFNASVVHVLARSPDELPSLLGPAHVGFPSLYEYSGGDAHFPESFRAFNPTFYEDGVLLRVSNAQQATESVKTTRELPACPPACLPACLHCTQADR